MRKEFLWMIPVFLLLSSCASILNQHFTTVRIETTAPAKIIVHQDTIETIENIAYIPLERKKETVGITTISDSLSKTISLYPKNSAAYLLNIPYTYGIGLLIEKDNPLRWTYPRRVFINSLDTSSLYLKFLTKDFNKQFRVHIGVPYVNTFLLKPKNETDTKVRTGFLGFSLGLEYFYSLNKSFAFKAAAVTDFPIFVPIPISYEGNYETTSSAYFSFTHNHKKRRWTYGYGLTYGKDIWAIHESSFLAPDPLDKAPVRRISYSIGAEFPVHYQLGRNFHLGLIYRPVFYRANVSPAFEYEHLISLDLAWKFNLYKFPGQ